MGDGIHRRDFLLGRFLGRSEGESGRTKRSGPSGEEDVEASQSDSPEGSGEASAREEDRGWKPGWEPLTEQQIDENRRQVRRQLGAIDEPEDRPFDALDFLASLEGEE